MSSTRPEGQRLVGAGDDEGHLPHLRQLPRGGLLAGDGQARRVPQVPLRDRGDAGRHGGREEHGLPLGAAWPGGSPPGPRRNPCRASRRPRPARRCGRRRASGCDAGCDRGRARASPPRPRRRASRRGSAGPWPPRRRAGTTLRPTPLAYLWIASATCIASSRVGTRTRPLVRPRSWPSSAIRWSMGSAKAAVLPVPVAAWPSTSRPESSTGMASRWTGVGSS